MDERALIHAMNELVSALKAQTGSMISGGSSLISTTAGQPAGGKFIGDLLKEQIDSMKLQTESMSSLTDVLGKSTKDQKDTFAEHAKQLSATTLFLSAALPMIQQYSKYAIARPYEMLGGTAGQVGRGMLEREKDAGQVMTALPQLLAGFATLAGMINPAVGAGIIGVAHVSQGIIGRGFQDEAIKAGGLQTVGQMTQNVPGFIESAKLQYGLMKQDIAALGAGAGSGRATSMAKGLTELGMSAGESTELIARATQAGGMQGFKRLLDSGGDKLITTMVNKGIYGTDPTAIATSLATGLRIGMSPEMLTGASRRTGLQLPEMAQAGMMARMQTYLAGPQAGNRLFTMASNTQMARDIGMPAAMGAITQAAGGAAAAASGDEASSMLLFKQFQEANPGATYMDFVEARSNKEKDPRWLKMVGGAARNFSGMGQMGRILGSKLLGVSASEVGGLSTTMGEALSAGGVGEITAGKGVAGLAKGAQQTEAAIFSQTLFSATKFQAEYGGEIEKSTKVIIAASEKTGDFTTMMKDLAEVMDKLTISGYGVVTRTWGNMMMRPDGTIDVMP